MISDNITYLKQYYPNIYNALSIQNLDNSRFQLIESKSGNPTIQVRVNDRYQIIHSKYDPMKEAQKLIDSYADGIHNYEHVLFYGVGLGYHVEEFMNRYLDYRFSLYEPSLEVFNLFMNTRNINQLPTHRLKNIFIGESREEGKDFLNRFTYEMQERILIIVLPSYQQIFSEQYKQFSEDFREAVSQKRQAYYVDNLFSARWTLNSLINFPKTIQTPNILNNEYKEYFIDKPLIIVSAGPSLEEEYENLRYIKEKKLAYIFAVGSANRALVAQNIMPDAVCTYDPQGHNYNVFASMIEQGITSVPMIYGTSVGFETLNMYRGPKLHMVTSQDTVSTYYLKNKDGSSLDCVDDSPTIAAVTFQLAAKLGCNPIIFAGQNLAFKNEHFYSKDVEYKKLNREIEVIDEDKQKVLIVKDVYGNDVETTPSFINMRDNIEFQITRFPDVDVINTTKGGAAIAGTVFKPLDQLMKETFTMSVVEGDWHIATVNQYDTVFTVDRIVKMERSIDSFRKLYREINNVLEEMNKSIIGKKEKKLEKLSVKFDKLMKKLIVNEAYLCYVQPVNRSQFQALTIRASNVRKQKSEVERAKLIMESFQPYLKRCKMTLEQIAGSVYRVHKELDTIVEEQYKFYPSDCGAFHYVGEWEKHNLSTGKTIDFPVKQLIGKNNANLSFKFTGKVLRIIGSKRKDASSNIQINIDGHIYKLSARDMGINESETSDINQILFKINNLEDKEHNVDIKVIDENIFMFSGLEIEENARLYHIYEVTNIEKLEVGKRIRCHYKAAYNKVGEFKGLGDETKSFIPSESSAYPDGDFYFIMVDEIDGKKKLIADRNVQHCISWDNLYTARIATKGGKGVFKEHHKSIINCRLMTGGVSSEDKKNEWDEYLVNSTLNHKIYQKDELTWNCGSITSTGRLASWTLCKVQGYTDRHMRRTFEGENQYAYTKYSISSLNAKNSGFRPLITIQHH